MKSPALQIGLVLFAMGAWSRPVAAAPNACPLTSSFLQPDSDPVWDDQLNENKTVQSNRTVLFDNNVVVFSEFMAVDADGSAHTYSAKDPMGELCNPDLHPENIGKDPVVLGCAMDRLCYGVKMRVPDGQGGYRVVDDSSCSKVAAAFQKSQAENWLPADGTRLAATAGIEMKDKEAPCIDENGAYLVSKTFPSGVASTACEQKKWLDSLVPFIVVPQCWTKTYRADNPKTCAYLKQANGPDLAPGDLVALLSRKPGDAPIFALIGDTGPNGKLGEASIGLLMRSEGKKEPPTYVSQSKKDKPDRPPTDWYDRKKKFDVVIFRGEPYANPITVDTYSVIEKAAHKKFTDWVGNDNASIARLTACGLKASPN